MTNPLTWTIAGSALLLFACSSLRHALFQSNAFDLGWFDQAVYLISQGQNPIVSIGGFHILGDHAAWIFYPLALLYKIYPNVHWLFAVQAIALSIGALPTFHLARQAGLKESLAIAMAAVYLLYPLVFNVNLFDFHPEVIALPLLLGAILAAQLGRVGAFCIAIAFILGCKAVLSLTVAAMGFWLLVFEKRRWCGVIALFAGVAWFLIATQWIIPFFSGHEAAAVGRYAYLGNSVLEIAQNLLFKPGLVLGKVFSLDTFEYLGLLVLPVIWGLSPQHLTPLVVAIPTLALNILSESPSQRNLVHQYSLPVLPFLLLVVIGSLAAKRAWLQNRRGIVLWALIAFLTLAKYGYFGSKYLETGDTQEATREAIAQIQSKGGVLVPSQVAPHLSHRPLVKLAIAGSESAELTPFQYVLLNLRHPGFGSTPQVVISLLERLKKMPEFQLTYQRDDVFLFRKKP
ncbi:MAG: DUF2079 domain-containing protein [Tolypothrix sp. T3-bin4]|nr:DUF2079 domain-containing protein [Tolypothrix sp. T3-bin4]